MSQTYDDIEIDEKKLRRMRFKIYSLETNNVKTRRYTHRDMVDKIHEIMVEEFKKTL